VVLASCTPSRREFIPLASFTENDVNVTLNLIHLSNGEYILSATYTPPDGYHLYSKDIPAKGVEGLGRPTLLELTPDTLMQATGTLGESAKGETPDFEPKELLVYPLGAITLSLPLGMPQGDQWRQDEVSVTYMACSTSQCKPPVVGKVISVKIPGADVLDMK
jgi:hypothetical protein